MPFPLLQAGSLAVYNNYRFGWVGKKVFKVEWRGSGKHSRCDLFPLLLALRFAPSKSLSSAKLFMLFLINDL